MAWPEVYLAFLISHLAGDFLLQTEWQAVNKRGGRRRDPERRQTFHLVCLLPVAIVAATA